MFGHTHGDFFSPCSYQEFALLQLLFIASLVFTVHIQEVRLYLLSFHLLRG